MTWLFALLLIEDAQSHAARVRMAMEHSLAKQRAAVQRQAAGGLTAPPVFAGASPACAPIPPPELARMIETASKEQAVDASLVREVARQESGFRPCAVSPAGAQGLMQLMPATQLTLDVRNPFDAQESISAGAKLLKQLLDRYNGDLALALGAYNAGPARVDRASGVPDIPETKDYVSGILGRLQQ